MGIAALIALVPSAAMPSTTSAADLHHIAAHANHSRGSVRKYTSLASLPLLYHCTVIRELRPTATPSSSRSNNESRADVCAAHGPHVCPAAPETLPA